MIERGGFWTATSEPAFRSFLTAVAIAKACSERGRPEAPKDRLRAEKDLKG